MHIKFLHVTVVNVEPFGSPGIKVPFHDGVTIIRGNNGAGKTTIAECLAMVGHCPLMEVGVKPDISYAGGLIRILIEAQNITKQTCEVIPLTVDLPEKFEIILYRENYGDDVVSDLKEYLSDESEINAEWRIAGQNKENEFHLSDEQIENFKKLIKFSRPILAETAESKIATKILNLFEKGGTKRPEKESIEDILSDKAFDDSTQSDRSKEILRSNLTSKQKLERLPPLVSYINTDMYEWGIGSDIRESPKNLNVELPSLLRRLGLISEETNRQAKNICGFDGLKEFWENIFGKDRILEGCGITKDGAGLVKISGAVRKFVSSGENQVLSIGMILEGLFASGSCLMLDEPELHADLITAKCLYEAFFRSALLQNNQIIVVSHLPFTFKRKLADLEEIKCKDGEKYRYFKKSVEGKLSVGLVYIHRQKSGDGYSSEISTGKEALGHISKNYIQEYKLIANQLEALD